MIIRKLATTCSAVVLGLALVAYGGAVHADDSGYGGNGSRDWGTQSDGLAKSRELIQMGSFGSAIWQLKRVLEDEPHNADAHNLLAFSYRSIERFELAERHYERALDIAPEHAGAHAYQGVLFLETGRAAQARDNLRKLRQICGTDCPAYRELRTAIKGTGSDA